jgi:hypothetical protein
MTGRRSPAAVFRSQIEAAERDGTARGDMTLRLTLTDVSQLKRDMSLAVSDISYANGVMRFLDVQVAQGSVTESRLDLG